MEMEIISRETIKPSSPTPPHLRIYPLSFIDHIVFRNYIPTLFFYNPNNHEESKISMLKSSLSKVLSIYYPLAGRLKDQLSIDCNDEGVTLLVTNIKSDLSQILANPNDELLNPLFPDELQWKEMNFNESILSIQINRFACGGIAISVCMCHKVGDAATLFNLVNDWSTINRQGQFRQIPVQLDVGVSLFPQGNLPVFPEVAFVRNDTVCRRFVFHAAKIESLKSIASSHVPNPTRVEVVTALIYKCAVSALGLSFKTTSLLTGVNIRKRTVPPLPEKSVGNLVWFLFVINSSTELHDLVRKMKERLCEFCDTYAKKIAEKDTDFICECMKQAANSVTEEETLIRCASWCRFPMYEADFGWGKPVWVITSGCPVRNSVVLMDTRDGDGIEALVNMEENDMAKFERHGELLQYASLNFNPLEAAQ